MTPFEQLKSLLNQFLNLADEVKLMLESEEYNEVISKLQYKDSLIAQLAIIKKNIKLDQEEENQIKIIESELQIKEKENIDLLEASSAQVAAELKKTNKNLKINSAYISRRDSQQGSMVDFSE